MKEKDFQHFINCLKKAIKNIDAHYFQLPIAGCIIGDDFPYKLNGEVDKSGHPLIRNAKKPDFIIHQPGNTVHNLVVIEVKPVTVKARISELRDDIETLKWFLNNANYYRAIILIYGNVNGCLPENIKTEIENTSNGRMLILWAFAPNRIPEIIRGEGYVV